jgi:hypothetical protein
MKTMAAVWMIHSEKDFFTESERLSLRRSVLMLRNKWTMVTGQDAIGYAQAKKTYFYTLGDSLYEMESNDKKEDDINRGTQKILLKEFKWIYDRIFKKIEELTGKQVKLYNGLTVPGFHISQVPIQYSPSYYHQDRSILMYRPKVDMNTVYSVLLLIEKPKNGAWLDYLDNAENKLVKHYHYGQFNMWKSTMPHKIGGFFTLPGEHRITLQCHYCADPNDNKTLLAYF